nr:unnamed protein product [Digitaria exilis]
MDERNTLVHVLLATWFLVFLQIQSTTAASARSVLCIPHERDALLAFRAGGLDDPDDYMSSWQGEDCCQWKGIRCSNRTGHVVELWLRSLEDVRSSIRFRGGNQRSSPLLDLKNLRTLDLRGNNFDGGPIPEFIGGLKSLRYLYISGSKFGGRVPAHLGNLSRLLYLDLNSIGVHDSYIYSTDLAWLPRLTRLEYLDLSNVNLSAATDWAHVVNKLPSLVTLNLRFCGLQNVIPSPVNVNLTSLEYLDLYGSIPEEVGNMTLITRLYLNVNNLTGTIPEELVNFMAMTHNPADNDSLSDYSSYGGGFDEVDFVPYPDTLSVVTKGQQLEFMTEIMYMVNLDLSCNNLSGHLPNGIGKLAALRSLNMSWNHLSGTIPISIGGVHALESLDLSHNELSGEIPSSLSVLTSLSHLNLSYNNLEGMIPSGNQLQALDDQPSIYIGNPGLCGPPL